MHVVGFGSEDEAGPLASLSFARLASKNSNRLTRFLFTHSNACKSSVLSSATCFIEGQGALGTRARVLSAATLNPHSRSLPQDNNPEWRGSRSLTGGNSRFVLPYVILTLPDMSFDALSMPPSGIADHSRMHCDSERTSYGNLQRRSRHTLAYLR